MGLLGSGVRAADVFRDGAEMVRPGTGSFCAGIAALAIGTFLGSQIPISSGWHTAEDEAVLASDVDDSKSSLDLAAPSRTSFEERFAGTYVSRSLVGTFEALEEEKGAENKLLPPPERATPDHPSVSARRLAPLHSSSLADAPNKKLRTADLAADASSRPEVDSHTAIYDLAAHTVYLPDGHRWEAHSGLGGYMDDARYVNVKDWGATPPNIYDLALRERTFHGVRAIRLNPIDDNKMFGREGMLAHPYMLGANGQSNGCVSFRDYPAFLNAFLKGDVNRLVVVEHLASVPSPKTASGWIPDGIKELFGFRRS
jgi:hypothetical protein